MGILHSLASRFAREPKISIHEVRASHQEVIDKIQGLSVTAIVGFEATKRSNSFLGGSPWLPPEMTWPKSDGSDCEFIAQVDLSEVPQFSTEVALPESGTLFFFVDFACLEKSNDLTAVLLYYPGPTDSFIETSKPSKSVIESTHTFVEFKEITSIPSEESYTCKDIQVPVQVDRYWHELFPSHAGSMIQLLGYPDPIQGDDMDREAQLISAGIDPYSSERNLILANSVEGGRHDWILLAQICGFDKTGCIWGDCGEAYFWIRKADLLNRDFSQVQLICQGY